MGARRAAGGARPARQLTEGARAAALDVFTAWDDSRAAADALLSPVFARHGMSGRDRDLAAEIVRGVFRWRGRLDWQLAHFVDRPLTSIDARLLWILRLGLYQIDRLDRIPPHAAVNTAVELAKTRLGTGPGNFVNAVLRRALRELADLVEPDAAVDPVAHLEARTSHPSWLLRRWLDRWGFRKTLALAAAGNRKPALTLRVVSDRVETADVIADLGARGIEARPGSIIPDSVVLPNGWDPAVRDLLEAGLCVVQDEAAGLVAHVARPARGLRILDVCAGLGGKVFHLAELCGDAEITACDLSPRRLRALRETAEKIGLSGVRTAVVDGVRPATRGGFGRVLVDAPCTNTGVLARRADARWRRGPEDLPRLAHLQGRLLDASRDQVGPGGILVYSTCSLEPEENEEVVSRYMERHPSDALLPCDDILPADLVSEGFLRTNPVDHEGLDGAFAAAIRVGGRSLRVVQ